VLSKKEIAEKLGVSESTIERWMKSRKIPYIKLNGIIRFDEEKINNWIRMKEVKTKSVA
jgi:excisionase family DNA binding protein